MDRSRSATPSGTCPGSRCRNDCAGHPRSTIPARSTSSDTGPGSTARCPMWSSSRVVVRAACCCSLCWRTDCSTRPGATSSSSTTPPPSIRIPTRSQGIMDDDLCALERPRRAPTVRGGCEGQDARRPVGAIWHCGTMRVVDRLCMPASGLRWRVSSSTVASSAGAACSRTVERCACGAERQSLPSRVSFLPASIRCVPISAAPSPRLSSARA